MPTTHSPSPSGETPGAQRSSPGLAFERMFSRGAGEALACVRWERRSTEVFDSKGTSPLSLRESYAPVEWSNAAVATFLAMYGAAHDGDGHAGSNGQDLRAMLERRMEALHHAALQGGYFARSEDAAIFCDELMVLILEQRIAFVEWPAPDRAVAITHAAVQPGKASPHVEIVDETSSGNAGETEGLASHRRREPLHFMTLDDPKVAALVAGREAYAEQSPVTVLALSSEMMLAADGAIEGRSNGNSSGALALLECIADSVRRRGGPVVSFAETIARWNPVAADGKAGSTYAASELRGTLNLVRFVSPAGELDLDGLRQAATILLTALEVGLSQAELQDRVPAAERDERRLALGFTGLSSLLMRSGVAYDSGLGRTLAASLSALLCGEALWHSARMAETCPAVAGPHNLRDAAESGSEDGTTRPGHASFGACPAFQHHGAAVLDAVRLGRAEANRIPARLAPDRVAEPNVVSIREQPGRHHERVVTGLAAQLPELASALRRAWDGALTHGEHFGYRNLQVTALADEPALGVMLDCEEPGLAPKRAVLKACRRSSDAGAREAAQEVLAGLFRLGYSTVEVNAIAGHLQQHGDVHDAPYLRDEDRNVFDCFATEISTCCALGPEAVLRMTASVQPFLSAANPLLLPLHRSASAREIASLLLSAWRDGLKTVALARAGAEDAELDSEPGSGEAASAAAESVEEVMSSETHSSGAPVPPIETMPMEAPDSSSGVARTASLPPTQTIAEQERARQAISHDVVMETQRERIAELEEKVAALKAAARQTFDRFDAVEPPRTVRHRLPAERASVTHAFTVGGHEGSVTVGLYPDGSPGEIFLRMTKEPSAVSGLLESLAAALSLGLQHGVPLRVLAEQFIETRFEPAGATGSDQIPYARSILDYLFLWMEMRFLSGRQLDLFAPHASPQQGAVAVTGSITGATSRVVPHLANRLSDLG